LPLEKKSNCQSENQLAVIQIDKCSTSSTLLPTISDGSLGAWDAAGVIDVVVVGLHKENEKYQFRIKN
jgi:hypothetical protein